MAVVATAGHVDHGKSTLVQFLTGTDPDRLIEEKQRGLTIDLGFATTVLSSGRQVSFVDVPGHARFIKNMLAGVGSVDACLFVVAATEGWKEQSEEHLRILEILGIEYGVVALTKAGHPSARPLDELRAELEERVAGTFLQFAEVVAIDVMAGLGTGSNGELVRALDRVVAKAAAGADGDKPRLWIDRSFPIRGSGTVVTGTLTGGPLRVGDHVVVEPAGTAVRVRGLQNHQRTLEQAEPGSRIAVNVSGISHRDIRRGNALVRPDQFYRCSVMDVSLDVFASLGHPVGRKGAFLVYLGSGEYPVRLRILRGADSIQPGASGLARIRLPGPLPLQRGDRFVLRDAGRYETVGGGEVLDVAPSLPIGRAHPDHSVARVVREHGWFQAAELERLTNERGEPTIGTWVVDRDLLDRTAGALMETVRQSGHRGVDLARCDDRQRLVLASIPTIAVEHGRAFLVEFQETAARCRFLEGHPFLQGLQSSPFHPPGADDVDRVDLALMARFGLIVDGGDAVWFATSAIDSAAAIVSELLARSPSGISVSEVGKALGTTRKYALPILALLDARRVTVRQGAVRVLAR
ncbi:MAG: selenocysteine-specific translation elongation factor [Acidimicrobiales bacterium]